MDAIICNAGNAIRLGKLGETIKKCLFRDPNTDKSILWHQLDALNYIGVENAFIVIKEDDKVIPVEVNRLKYRFPKMNLKCVSGHTKYMMDSIKVGLNNVTSDTVIKLDGDVCLLQPDSLKNLIGKDGNILCIYKMKDIHKKNGTPILTEDGYLDFFENYPNSEYSWSCIEMWKTDDLKNIVDNCPEKEKNMLLYNINKYIKNLNIDCIEIPCVYEIDDTDDYSILLNKWKEYNIELENKCLEMWKNFSEYPKFSEDKTLRINIDTEIVKKYCNNNESVVDIGAGIGDLSESILKHIVYKKYTLVEPNRFYCDFIKQNMEEKYKNVEIINKSSSEFLELDNEYDTSLMLGCILYFIDDENLIKNLKRLKSKKLILKASEPDVKKFSRLLVNEYSENLKSHYISMYRSLSEVCKILRNSGWNIKEINRNIYKENDSKFGNSSFIIYTERN